MVLKVFCIVVVAPAKRAFSPAVLGQWAPLQQQRTFIHFRVMVMHNQHND
jgi:hypothetical protein